MLPVITSMVFGGLAKSTKTQGFGGILMALQHGPGHYCSLKTVPQPPLAPQLPPLVVVP
jgi:hypothetical protein